MAGPSVVVRFLGDLSSLGSSFAGAEKQATSMAKNAHQAFSTMLGALNKTGVLGPFGDVLGGVDDALGTIAEHGKKLGPVMAGVGVAVTGIGVTLSAVGSKEKASHQQLQAAISATGKSYEDYAGKIEGAVKQQENYGHTADQTQDALRILTQATHDPAKAIQMLGTVSDVAAAKHEDLSSAATAMGKVYNGNTRLLKEFGVTAETTAKVAQKQLETATNNATKADDAAAKAKQNLSDLQARLSGKTQLSISDQQHLRDAMANVATTSDAAKKAHEKLSDAQDAAAKSANAQRDNIEKVANVTKGQAAAAADTFAGKLDKVKAKIEDSVAQLGQKYGPALQGVGAAATVLGSIWSVVGPAMAADEDLSLWPILLIVVGIAGLIVAVYELWKHWSTVWGWIKKIAMDVWNWLKVNWPLLLPILFGPIGLAAALIIKYFSDIKQWAADAVNFIKRVWNDLWAFFARITTDIRNWFSNAWGAVSGAASSAVAGIQGAWGSFWSWFSGIPGDIARLADNIWSPLENGFKNVVNGIAHGWNSTVGAIHFSIPSWIPGIGGKGFDMPNIPTLAQGGLITSTGFVYAHAGEAISPIPNGVGGPAVHIENVNVSDELDVDVFMRRVAFNVRTAKL